MQGLRKNEAVHDDDNGDGTARTGVIVNRDAARAGITAVYIVMKGMGLFNLNGNEMECSGKAFRERGNRGSDNRMEAERSRH